MYRHFRASSRAAAALVLLLCSLSSSGTAFMSPAGIDLAQADPAFDAVWSRTDKPVQDRLVARTWFWGPQAFQVASEPYAEGPEGRHLVAYFDKSRMEVNNPSGDRASQWYVTNGLLVAEMMSGRVQTGNKSFTQLSPAAVPVAGDAAGGTAPTYATLSRVASLNNDNRATDRSGQNIREGMGRGGNIAALENLAGLAKYAVYEPVLGHNIPDVFWSFLTSKGPVYTGGKYAHDTLVDWVFAAGYPITEPYWVQLSAGGQDRWVLVQAFQRRILTYSPFNAPGWRVEMGNVGRAYYDWRYKGQAQPPAPPASPPQSQPPAAPVPASLASIAVDPAQGDTNTGITVTGSNFPPSAAVTINVESAAAGYSRNVASVASGLDGSFTARIGIPVDAAKLPEVTITASSGSQKASRPFRLVFEPSISVSPDDRIESGGTVTVMGAGFFPNTSLTVSLYANRALQTLGSARTTENGSFTGTYNIGRQSTGTQFTIIVTGENSLKVESGERLQVVDRSAIVPAPKLSPLAALNLSHSIIAAGQRVTANGAQFPANVRVALGVGRDGGPQEWVAFLSTGASGSFTAVFALGSRWNGAGPIKIYAVTQGGTLVRNAQVFTSYGRVVPQGQQMSVTMNKRADSALYKLNGEGWGAGQTVDIRVMSGDGAIYTAVGSAVARADGSFEASFAAASPWVGRADMGVVVTARNGGQYSVRYLPVGILFSVPGTAQGPLYRVLALNLPPNMGITAIAHRDGQAGTQVGSGSTDAAGIITLGVQGAANSIELRTQDDYTVFFNF